MTDFPAWAVGLTGSRYIAARNLHTAAQALTPAQLARTLADCHHVGLDRNQLAAIITHARPRVPATELAGMVRYRRPQTDRASFDLDERLPPLVEDGPGPWPPYVAVLTELRSRLRPAGDLTAPEAVHAARTLAPTHDDALAAVLCAAHIVGPQKEADKAMTLYRMELVLGMWDQA